MRPWQTQITMFLGFPFRCANFKWEGATELLDFFADDEIHDGDDPGCDELAFYCVFNHRILKSECLGMECPACKLIGHDEYIQRIKEAAQ